MKSTMYESIYVEIMIMPRVKKRGRFCFEKSKEAENNFLTLWMRVCLVANSQIVTTQKYN